MSEPNSEENKGKSVNSINEEIKTNHIEMSPSDILKEKFNYYFDSDLKLRNTLTNSPYCLSSHSEYDNLVKIIQKYIQNEMKEKYLMKEKFLPKKAHSASGPFCNIFVSQNWSKSLGKALILIQGSGGVRAGMWSRSVCVYDSLKNGSMLPFLDFAKQENYEVIVLNPNYTNDPESGRPVPFNNSLEAHGAYVWENYVRKSKASEIYIVAHSCGGVSTMSLAHLYWEEFKNRVKGIAFTDTVHSYHGIGSEKNNFFERYAVEWVSSTEKLDTFIRKHSKIICVSAGHPKHEFTTGAAFGSILNFLRVVAHKNPFLEEFF